MSGRRKKKNFGKAGWERAAGVKKNEEGAARGFFFEEGLGKAGWEGKQKQRKTEGETKRRDVFLRGQWEQMRQQRLNDGRGRASQTADGAVWNRGRESGSRRGFLTSRRVAAALFSLA